jgi:hypothetical protein
MKPFVINRSSWHYKLNKHFFNEYYHNMEYWWEPRHNNFCTYWRVTIFRIIVACLLVVAALATLYFIGGAIYYHPIDALILTGTVIGVIVFCILAVLISEKLMSRSYKHDSKPESLLMQRYRAHKSKICPMVEYKK